MVVTACCICYILLVFKGPSERKDLSFLDRDIHIADIETSWFVDDVVVERTDIGTCVVVVVVAVIAFFVSFSVSVSAIAE